MSKRQTNLMPNGIPRYVRIYDNGGRSFDRYTCLFTGRYKGSRESKVYLGMSERPYHPQGVGMHGESRETLDARGYSHLGTPVQFTALPDEVQRCIIQTYRGLWEF